MRDPARVERLVALLREIWAKEPEWRLGQIVHNAIDPKEACGEIYCASDETMEALLASMSSSLTKMREHRKQERQPDIDL